MIRRDGSVKGEPTTVKGLARKGGRAAGRAGTPISAALEAFKFLHGREAVTSLVEKIFALEYAGGVADREAHAKLLENRDSVDEQNTRAWEALGKMIDQCGRHHDALERADGPAAARAYAYLAEDLDAIRARAARASRAYASARARGEETVKPSGLEALRVGQSLFRRAQILRHNGIAAGEKILEKLDAIGTLTAARARLDAQFGLSYGETAPGGERTTEDRTRATARAHAEYLEAVTSAREVLARK